MSFKTSCVKCGSYSRRKFLPQLEDSKLPEVRLCRRCDIFFDQDTCCANQCVKTNLLKTMMYVYKTAIKYLRDKKYNVDSLKKEFHPKNGSKSLDKLDIRTRELDCSTWYYIHDVEKWFISLRTAVQKKISDRNFKIALFLNPPLSYRNRKLIKILKCGKTRMKFCSLGRRKCIPILPAIALQKIFDYTQNKVTLSNHCNPNTIMQYLSKQQLIFNSWDQDHAECILFALLTPKAKQFKMLV